MKGQREFNSKSISKIRKLLVEKADSTREDQKHIRQELRKIGFYISDFRGDQRSGFTANDFDELLKKGIIKKL